MDGEVGQARRNRHGGRLQVRGVRWACGGAAPRAYACPAPSALADPERRPGLLASGGTRRHPCAAVTGLLALAGLICRLRPVARRACGMERLRASDNDVGSSRSGGSGQFTGQPTGLRRAGREIVRYKSCHRLRTPINAPVEQSGRAGWISRNIETAAFGVAYWVAAPHLCPVSLVGSACSPLLLIECRARCPSPLEV
jgi:hypothetical protein